MQKYILFLFIFTQCFPPSITNDADCFAVQNPSIDTDCTSVDTFTYSICCFATYEFSNGTKVNQCLTIDGTNPQNTVESIETAKGKLPSDAVTKDITCKTHSEICYEIKSPTSFDSCNITEQLYPFSCCYVETEKGNYCYPLNAKYQNYIDTHVTNIKEAKNLTQNPKVVCSNKPLPVLKAGSYITLTKLSFIIVMMLFISF